MVVEVGAGPPLLLTKGPIRFPVSEQLVQRDADIFLIKLLAIIGAARIPTVATQSRIVAGDAQLVHRAVHWVRRITNLRLWRAEVFGMGREKKWEEQKNK